MAKYFLQVLDRALVTLNVAAGRFAPVMLDVAGKTVIQRNGTKGRESLIDECRLGGCDQAW
jgi:hypothetical protein